MVIRGEAINSCRRLVSPDTDTRCVLEDVVNFGPDACSDPMLICFIKVVECCCHHGTWPAILILQTTAVSLRLCLMPSQWQLAYAVSDATCFAGAWRSTVANALAVDKPAEPNTGPEALPGPVA